METPSQYAHQDTDLGRHRCPSSYSPGSPEISTFAQLPVPGGSRVTLTDLQYINVGKVPYSPSALFVWGANVHTFAQTMLPSPLRAFLSAGRRIVDCRQWPRRPFAPYSWSRRPVDAQAHSSRFVAYRRCQRLMSRVLWNSSAGGE